MNRLRLEYAAESFLQMMRREFAKRHPDMESPIASLQNYSAEDRSSLMRSIAAAVKSSQTDADGSFNDWCERRSVPAE